MGQIIVDLEARIVAAINSAISTSGSNANTAIFNALLPVGSIIHSMLTEATFNSLYGSNKWIIADGRSVSGSSYAAYVGSNVPDLRGIFLRGKNNGVFSRNADGELALGTYKSDRLRAHSHVLTGYTGSGVASMTNAPELKTVSGVGKVNTSVANSTLEGDTAPSSVTVNIFIRIN